MALVGGRFSENLLRAALLSGPLVECFALLPDRLCVARPKPAKGRVLVSVGGTHDGATMPMHPMALVDGSQLVVPMKARYELLGFGR